MRYKVIFFIIFVIVAILINRLYQISINKKEYYEKLAKENVEKVVNIMPLRGEILDSKGNLLAKNVVGFSLAIKPHLKVNSQEFNNTILEIKKHFKDIDLEVLKKVYKKNNSPYNHKYIQVLDFIPYKDMMKIYPTLQMVKNVKISPTTKREYPYGKYLAHIVGYIGKTSKKEAKRDILAKKIGKIGKSGIEKYYNAILQGKEGKKTLKVNAVNKVLEELNFIPPQSNQNIILGIDTDLQKFIYDELGDTAAAVVVMQTDGQILAAVSNPSFDPNLFVDGISAKDWKALRDNLEHPFTNKFISATYPPGSVIKMGVALVTSKVAGNFVLNHEYCKGYITIGKSTHKFRCWSHWGHGDVDLRKSVRESCDVFYYNKALKIGIDNLSKGLKEIGLGVKTGVDLPREFRGIIPNKEWKKKRYHQSWYKGETVIAAIGQGYTNVTLMQVARYTALLATSKLVTPHFAKIIHNKEYQAQSKKIEFDPYVFSTIREGMFDVCNNKRGTAYRAMHDLPIVVAGKTGTAQVVSIAQDVKKRAKEEDMEYFRRSHAWLTTYAPYKNPKIVVSIIVEHGGHGGSAAGPIAAKIYEWLYDRGYFDSPEDKIEDEDNDSVFAPFRIDSNRSGE